MRPTIEALAWPSVVISVLAQVVTVVAYFTGLVSPAVAFTVIGVQLVAGWLAVSFEYRTRLTPTEEATS